MVIGSSPVAPNRSKEHQYAGVVQLVRAPACHAGSCGFKPRLPRHFYIITQSITFSLVITLLLSACSSHSLDDFREEGEGIVHAITAELKQIRSRDDLPLHAHQLQLLFDSFVAVIIEMEEYKNTHPQAVASLHNKKEQIASDQLRIELNRILQMEGGREVIEKVQENALNRLDAYEQVRAFTN